MNNNQITALACEYADRCDGSLESYEETKAILLWLSDRFCLVEKSKVEEEYHEAKFACGNIDSCSETWATYLAQKSVLERLFPEIGKEVEE